MQTSRKHLSWLLLILIAGIVLRLFHLDHSGIWLDEKISLAESNGFTYSTAALKNYFTTAAVKQQNTIENVFSATIKEDGGNGILYILKLHYWQQLFGSSDGALRMLSLILGCLIIIAIYYFTLTLFKLPRVALISALLIAVHPMLIAYSQEMRPYSMATLFSLLSTFYFYRAFIESKAAGNLKLNCIAFGFFSSCSIFTHYLTAYVFLAQGFYFLFYVREKKIWTTYLISWFAVIAIFILWMMNGGFEGLQHMSIHNLKYAARLQSLNENEDPFLLQANFKNVFLGWIQLLLATAGNTLQQGGYRLRLLWVFLLIPFAFVLIASRKNDNTNKRKLVLLFMLSLSAPIYATLLALIAGHTISFQPAYGIFAAPYIAIAVALGFEKLLFGNYTLVFKSVLIGVFGLIIFTSLYFRYTINSRTYSDEYSNPLIGLADKIKTETNASDTIVFPLFSDAVITNIYLPANLNAVQMVDSTANDKVILKNNGKILLDFENGKFRY